MTPTLPQTVGLLRLSRGEHPDVLPPLTRRALLRARWIAPPRLEITEAGRRALAGSQHLARAQREVDSKAMSVAALVSTTNLSYGAMRVRPNTRIQQRKRARVAAAVLRGAKS